MSENVISQETQVFRLPDVGEGLTEAEIVAWHVAAGDQIKVNQVLCEIETAKSIVELPSPFEGTVATLLAAVGDTVPVGYAIIEVASPEGSYSSSATTTSTSSIATSANAQPQVAANTEAVATQSPEATTAETPKLLVGYGATDPGQSRRRRARGGAVSIAASTTAAATASDERVKPRAKPPVRGLAKQLGVDLNEVRPTGPNGTVTREDVQRAASTLGSTSPNANGILFETKNTGTTGTRSGAEHRTNAQPRGDKPKANGTSSIRIPIKGVRKATAAAMVESAFTAPHVTEFITVDVTASLELLEQVQRRREFADVKLTPLSLVARAYLRAISRTPMAAAHWDDAAQEIVVPGSVNLGIAAATPRGLLVPNIKGANELGLLELAQAIGGLAATARAGKTPPTDLAGGDTTITNIGVFGIDTGTPILNPGETTILAVGAIQRRPWVVGSGETERIEPRSVMQLALSFDHRVLDGAEGSRLLSDAAEVLTNPGLALL